MNNTRIIKNFKNTKPIRISYYQSESDIADSPIVIYDDFKITVRLTGGFAAIVNNNVVYTERGDVLLFNPQEIHFGRFLRSGTHKYLTILIPVNFFENFACTCEKLKYIFTDNSLNRINCIRASLNDKIKTIELAEKIIELLDSDNENADICILGLLIEFLSFCSDLYIEQKENPISTDVPAHVLHIVAYIHEHYAEQIKMEDISAHVGCSTTYASLVFKKYMNLSVYQYIINYRILKAAALLKSELSVTEVCYACGFGDCSNFIKTFKKIIGESPHQYKKTHINS